MSLNKTQIDTLIQTNTKCSTVSYSIAERTVDENLALDKAFALIFQVGGRWQFDDSNHTDNPIVRTNMVSGQRNYAFTTDEQGNLILEFFKVMVKQSASSDVYVEIFPVDQQSDEYVNGFWDNVNVTGIPTRYDKTANGIFLDCVPSYNATQGIKIIISRVGSYFTTSDTTKKPGFAGLFHEYVALRPSYFYALRNNLKNVNGLKNEMLEMERDIKKHYRDRSKDENLVVSGEEINSI